MRDYQTPDPGWCGDPSRGASMGRSSNLPEDTDAELTITSVAIDEGGYDSGGSYWGAPSDLFCASDDDGRVHYLRAKSLDEAKSKFPRARFKLPIEVTEADIAEMVQGYIEAALWSSNDDDDEPFDANYSIDDIAPESLAKMTTDCRAFATKNAADLLVYSQHRSWAHAGHDFWLTRCGHGVGFWDRGLGELGDRLSKACRRSEIYLYVGDDGKVHCE